MTKESLARAPPLTNDNNAIVLNIVQDPRLEFIDRLVVACRVARVDNANNIGSVGALR